MGEPYTLFKIGEKSFGFWLSGYGEIFLKNERKTSGVRSWNR
jgi:hypothetical protein